MTLKLAINGFGRIGRVVFREALKSEEIEVVAINDLTNPAMLAHLLKYDSVHGVFDGEVSADGEYLVVNGKKVRVYEERDPGEHFHGESSRLMLLLSLQGFSLAQKHLTSISKLGRRKLSYLLLQKAM